MRALAFGLIGLIVGACGRIDFGTRPGDGGDGGGGDGGSIDASPAMPSGLIAWWKLDESSGTTAADSAGNTDGTFTGPGILTWEPTGGEVNGALSFPANAAATVYLGTPPVLANLPALTIVAWIQPAAVASLGANNCFFDHGNFTSGWATGTGFLAQGDFAFYASLSGTTEFLSTAPNSIPAGTWARVAATWDGSDEPTTGIHLYLGGVEVPFVASGDVTGTRTDDSMNDVALGCISGTGYVGLLDDVQIYDRVLAPAELVGL